MGSLPRKLKVVASDPQWEMYGVRIDEDAIPAVYDGFRIVYNGEKFTITDPSDEIVGSSTSAKGARSIIEDNLREWLEGSGIESTLGYSAEWALWKLGQAVRKYHEDYLVEHKKFNEECLARFNAVRRPKDKTTVYELITPVYETRLAYLKQAAEVVVEKMARGWLDHPADDFLAFNITKWARDLVGKAKLVTGEEHLRSTTNRIPSIKRHGSRRNVDLGGTTW